MYSITRGSPRREQRQLVELWSGRQSQFVSVQNVEPKTSWMKTMLAIWLSNLRFALLFGSTATAVNTRLQKYDKFWFSSINTAVIREEHDKLLPCTLHIWLVHFTRSVFFLPTHIICFASSLSQLW